MRSLDIRVRLVLILFSVFIFLTGGCQRIPAKYRSFLALSPQQQHDQMRTLSTDDQMDYYLAGMRYVHPPQVGLARDIAERGTAAVPIVLRRLREEKDENTQIHLMHILQVMHRCCHRLEDNREVIESLTAVTASMQNRDFKDEADGILMFIMTDRERGVKAILDSMTKDTGRD